MAAALSPPRVAALAGRALFFPPTATPSSLPLLAGPVFLLTRYGELDGALHPGRPRAALRARSRPASSGFHLRRRKAPRFLSLPHHSRRHELRLSEGGAPQPGVAVGPTDACAASCIAASSTKKRRPATCEASSTAPCTVRGFVQPDELEGSLHLVDSISGGKKHTCRLSLPHLGSLAGPTTTSCRRATSSSFAATAPLAGTLRPRTSFCIAMGQPI